MYLVRETLFQARKFIKIRLIILNKRPAFRLSIGVLLMALLEDAEEGAGSLVGSGISGSTASYRGNYSPLADLLFRY